MSPDELENFINSHKEKALKHKDSFSYSHNSKNVSSLISLLSLMPKNKPSSPILRQKYLTLITTKNNLNFFNIFQTHYVWSGVLAFSILLIASFSVFTAQSLPGQTLFNVKKSAEQFRIKFATNNIQKAYLQVELAKKRVKEAEKVFNENSSPELQIVAFNEISKATEQATKQIETIKSIDKSELGKTLISSLEDLSKKEENLAESLPENSPDDVIAFSLKNRQRVSELKQAVSISSAESALTNLTESPDLIFISGKISNISNNSISVEKTIFSISKNTAIIDSENNQIQIDQIKIGDNVVINGEKNAEEIIAVKIVINFLKQNSNEGVKGANTLNSTTPPSLIEEEVDPKNNTQQDSNQVKGNYIFEDPNPKYSP